MQRHGTLLRAATARQWLLLDAQLAAADVDDAGAGAEQRPPRRCYEVCGRVDFLKQVLEKSKSIFYFSPSQPHIALLIQPVLHELHLN